MSKYIRPTYYTVSYTMNGQECKCTDAGKSPEEAEERLSETLDLAGVEYTIHDETVVNTTLRSIDQQ